jgi:hypothetical protein
VSTSGTREENSGVAGSRFRAARLFSVTTMDEILAAFEAHESNYQRHGRAARAIAEEHFRAETVLRKLLDDLSRT